MRDLYFDTKPEKAEASAVEVPITREMAIILVDIGRQAAEACGISDAALQSSSSAEAELRAAREVGEKFGTNATQRKLYGDIAEAGARAALNHGKGEDDRAASTKDQGGEHGE